MSTMEAPTAATLLLNPHVLETLEAAWIDSLPDDPDLRHEEGGWIYINLNSREVFAHRAEAGVQAALDLENPPQIEGAFVVATFHTHPNPTRHGWDPGPSAEDTSSAWLFGVPCIIRADDGIYTTGPESRRGGVAGNSGFPE